MAHTKNTRKTHRRRRHRGSKRRGQTGGASLAPLSFAEVSGPDTAGGAANMIARVGLGQAQTTNPHGSIAVNAQTGGARRRKYKKTKGGSLVDALSGAIVPLALFGANYKYGNRRTKKR